MFYVVLFLLVWASLSAEPISPEIEQVLTEQVFKSLADSHLSDAQPHVALPVKELPKDAPVLQLKGVEKKASLWTVYNTTCLLERGELDAQFLCKNFFPKMTPEEINGAFRDIRKFIEHYIKTAIGNDLKKVGEGFLTDILHVYGYLIRFIENAWVDRKTKRVFVEEKKDSVTNADRLMDYWWFYEQSGHKLYCYKAYANCIDLLNILIRAHFMFPCYSEEQLKEMDSRWLWWLEKVTGKLRDNPIFGGYYQENVRLFREVYALWKNDFELKAALSSDLTKKRG
jgi:hypothetical protein